MGAESLALKISTQESDNRTGCRQKKRAAEAAQSLLHSVVKEKSENEGSDCLRDGRARRRRRKNRVKIVRLHLRCI